METCCHCGKVATGVWKFDEDTTDPGRLFLCNEAQRFVRDVIDDLAEIILVWGIGA